MRLGDKRIAESDLAARAGMHGEDAVILRDELCERDEFVAFRVDAGLVHEPEGAAERAAAHRLVHEFHLRLYLRGSERTGGIAGNAYPGRPLPHERHEIEHEPPFRTPFEFGKGARLHRAEKPAAHLVAVRGGLRDPERRKAAVARYLSGDALPEEGGVKHLRVIAVVEKVVVGMSVYESRRDDEPGAVDHGVRLSGALPDFGDDPAFDEDIAEISGGAGAVDYPAAFEKYAHIPLFARRAHARPTQQ